jgi:glycosyltransferase-like protein
MTLSIGIFTYSVRPRGSVVHAAALAEALTDRGHDVTLYALRKPGDTFYRPLRCRLRSFDAEAAPNDLDALIRQRIAELADGLAAERPQHDVYHAEDCLAANALLAARSRGVTNVVRTVHHVERFESRYLLECQRRSIEGADALLSVSGVTRRDVLREFGRVSSLVPNGVDVARFARKNPEREAELRRRAGASPDDTLLLSVGGVEPRKNSLRILEAFAAACETRRDLVWAIAGGASIFEHAAYRTEFSARVAELPAEVRTRIHTLGVLAEDELTALYRASSVLLSPSTHEGFGLSALEALAAGTAIIASNRAPFTEYLDDAVACLVDPESPVAMRDAILRLAVSAQLRNRSALAGERRAQAFGWSRVAEGHEHFYREFLGKNRRHVAPTFKPEREVSGHA